MEEITEKKNHNIMMIDIASTLNYVKFDEEKDYGTCYEMWIKMKAICGGDDNVRRANVIESKTIFVLSKLLEERLKMK